MIILYGDNTVDSSQRLVQVTDEIKTRGVSVHTFDQSELTLGRFRQELSPTDLFGGTSFLVIKNLLSGTKSKTKDKIIDFLKSTNPGNLLLFETKTVHPSTVKQFKGATLENFKVNVNIFKFLEKVFPHNTKSLLLSYQELISQNVEPRFIFAMLVRQVRQLIQIKTSPHLLKLAPFSERLLRSQSQQFTLEALLDLHLALYRIECGIKTGQTPLDLNSLLRHLLESL